MQCTCGGSTTDHYHTVKTPRGLSGWLRKAKVPSRFGFGAIYRNVCESCGRQTVEVYQYRGKARILIESWG